MEHQWFTLDSIVPVSTAEKLYCIGVDSPSKQFLIGHSGVPTHNTDQGKLDDEMKGEAQMIIGSIARLGRAAGTHLVIATQRPDATLISGETKANLGCRISAGRTDSNASSMILGSGEGTRVKPFPPGRLYIRIYSHGDHGHGFYADQSWIDDYLKSQGKNPDGSPIAQGKQSSRKANLVDMETFGDGDLDSREGIDTQAAIDSYIAGEEDELEDDFNIALDDDGSFDFNTDEDSEGSFDFEVDDEDDGSFGFENVADEPKEQEPTKPGDMSAPLNFGTKKEKTDQFARPEDDWDNELEALIEENFDD